MRPPLPSLWRRPGDLPIPVRGVSVRATGSTTAQGTDATRATAASAVAFRAVRRRRLPGLPLRHRSFHGSIPGPHVPLSTLRPGLYRPLRMTRGRCGSLCLHRMTLPFTTPRRFLSAHRTSATKIPSRHSGMYSFRTGTINAVNSCNLTSASWSDSFGYTGVMILTSAPSVLCFVSASQKL